MRGNGNACTQLFSCMVGSGFLPLSYHLNDDDERQQHYNATAIWSAVLTFATMAIFLGVEGFRRAHDEEHQWYDNLDDVFHRVAAFVTLAAINLAVAGFLALLHRYFQNKRKGPEYTRLIVSEEEDDDDFIESDTQEPPTQQNEWGEQVSVSCPRKCFSPPTPMKTFLWSLFITSAATIVTLAIRPDYLEDLFKSDFSHYGAVGTGAVLTAAGAAGLFTGLHWIGAKIHDCVDPEGSENHSAYMAFKE